MTPRARTLAIAASLVVMVGGCSAAAHLQALQPPPPRLPPPPPPVPAAVSVREPRVQLGVDIDAYTFPGQNVFAAARADVAYIRSLHANSVMISLPFFANGPGDPAHATKETLSPQALGMVIRMAEHAGLYVLVRPLLDERTLGGPRARWVPPNLGNWFAGYLRYLLPYAEVAQRDHVPEFAVGAELSSFETVPGWNRLDSALRRHYGGKLVFTVNGDKAGRGIHAGGARALNTVDAYPLVAADRLTAGWERYDRALPRHTVVTEVGIAAVRGANRAPSRWHWNGPLDQAVQVQWFGAACHAAEVTHLGGMYFWSIALRAPVTPGPTPADQGAWTGGAGARAVAGCFAWLGRGRRA